MYSPSTRIAFLHVHKTGGESLRVVLQRHLPDLCELPGLPGAHHPLATVHETLEREGVDPSSLRFLATICHPMSHAVSIYHYWRSDRIPTAEQALPHVALTRQLDFHDFLRQVLVRDQFEENLVVEGALPDNVTLLRRESLRSDTERALGALLGERVTVDMPRINRSSHAGPQHYFDEAATQALARSYRWTFEHGWYDIGEVPPDESPLSRRDRIVARIRELGPERSA